MASLSFRWFVDVKTSPGGLDVSVRQSGDASDEETFIEIDLGTPPSNGIRVVSVPVDSEFCFPCLESGAPLAFADKLFSRSPKRPHLTEPPSRGLSPPQKNPRFASKQDLSLAGVMMSPSSMRSRTPTERIIKNCMRFLKPTFGCFHNPKPSPREVRDLETRSLGVIPAQASSSSSSSTISLAEHFLKP